MKKAITRTQAVAIVVIIIVAVVGGAYFSVRPTGPSSATTSAPTTTSAVPNPDTLTIETTTYPESVDPATDYDIPGGQVIANAYENLLWYNHNDSTRVIPWLAENYTVSPDGLIYTFTMRQGIKFADGTSVDANAVKYSIDRVVIMNQPPAWILSQDVRGGPTYSSSNTTKADAQTYMAAGGVTVINSNTVQIALDHPYAAFPYVLASAWASPIVSPTCVEAHGGVVPGQANNWMNLNTCGSGPYQLSEWIPNQRYTLTRNDGWWGGPDGIKPQLKTITFKIEQDILTRELDLFGGSADMADIPSSNIFDVMSKQAWITNRTVVPTAPGVAVEVGALVPIDNYIQFGNLQLIGSPYNNTDFRKGIAYAFNYGTYLSNAINGMGTRLNNVLPQGIFGYDPTLPAYSYNLTQAKYYLTQSGFQGTFQFYYLSGDEVAKRAGLILQEELANLNMGITVELVEMARSTFFEKVRAGTLPFFALDWYPDYADPDDYAYYLLHGAWTKDMDNLIEQALREQDPQKRFQLYGEIQRMDHDAVLFIYLYQPVFWSVHRDWVKIQYTNGMWAGGGGIWFPVVSKG